MLATSAAHLPLSARASPSHGPVGPGALALGPCQWQAPGRPGAGLLSRILSADAESESELANGRSLRL